MRPIRLTEDEEIIAEEEAKINSKFYMDYLRILFYHRRSQDYEN